jgi:transcription-repair coupling factor (superfamily II helicase)
VDAADWAATLPDLTVERAASHPLAKLSMRQQRSQQRLLVLAESDGRRESLMDFIRAGGINPVVVDDLEEFLNSTEPFGLATSGLHTGFAWLEKGIDLVTETELFAASPTVRRRRKQEAVSDVESLINDLSELNVGDPVVHSAHGIGRYRGLVNMDMGQGLDDQGQPLLQEFLHLEYADEATLYVPVSQLHLISRYSGVSPDQAPLHRLGSGQWDKARRRAAEQVRDAAAELLNIYARRAARQGHAFRYTPQDYETFATDFGFGG